MELSSTKAAKAIDMLLSSVDHLRRVTDYRPGRNDTDAIVLLRATIEKISRTENVSVIRHPITDNVIDVVL